MCYSGEPIAPTGFYVYPGGHKVSSIDLALELIDKIDGLDFPDLNSSLISN
ncbi:hypothetical protein [Rubritalea tangerina]